MITNKTGGTLYTRDGRKLIDIKGVSGSSRTSEEICAQRKVKHTVPDTLCFQTVSGVCGCYIASCMVWRLQTIS